MLEINDNFSTANYVRENGFKNSPTKTILESVLCNLFHDRFTVSGCRARNKLNVPKCRLSTGQRSQK